MRNLVITIVMMCGLLAGMSAQSPTVEDLGWLAGCWSMPRPDGFTEEHWMRPAGGTMFGMNRTVRAGRTIEFEFLQIAMVDERLALLARPSGQAPATFPVKSVATREVVFENPDHDFPQRVIYRLTGDGALLGRVEGVVDGQARSVEFPFRQCESQG